MFVGHFGHLVGNNFAGNLSSEHHCAGEVSSVTGVGSAHHVLSVECLLGKLRDRQDTVRLDVGCRERCETNQEEVETWEGDQVHGELSEIAVQLTRESKRTCCSGNGVGNQVIQVRVGWVGKLQGPTKFYNEN